MLIELFRDCHDTIENGFYLETRTLHHSPPDMTKTLRLLAREFSKTGHHVFTPGREAQYEAPDQLERGMDLIRNTRETSITLEVDTTVETDLDHELEAEDLGALEC